MGNGQSTLQPEPEQRSKWLSPHFTANDMIRDVVGPDSGMPSSMHIRKSTSPRGYSEPCLPEKVFSTKGQASPAKNHTAPRTSIPSTRGYSEPCPPKQLFSAKDQPIPKDDAAPSTSIRPVHPPQDCSELKKVISTKDQVSPVSFYTAPGVSVPPGLWGIATRTDRVAIGSYPSEACFHQLLPDDNGEASSLKDLGLDKGILSMDAGLPGQRKSTNDDEANEESSAERTCANSLTKVTSKSLPPAHPPSVEAAYKKKCVALKQRIQEVEANNDRMRLQKVRNKRQINKMRLERAILLSHLEKMAQPDGSDYVGLGPVVDPHSEDSSEGPPTPVNKPMRLKKSHTRRPPSPPAGLQPLASQPLYTQQTPSGHYQSVFPMNEDPNASSVSNMAVPNGGNNNPYSTRRHHASNKNDYDNSFPYAVNAVGHQRQQHQSSIAAAAVAGIDESDLFASFFQYYFQSQPEKHGNVAAEELIQKARASFTTLPPAEKEHLAGRVLMDYEARMEELNRAKMKRDDKSEDEEVEEEGNGGFTAVNG